MITEGLEGVGILIPRPEGRGDDLMKAIRTAGGEVVRFPVLDILLDSTEVLLRPGGRDLKKFSLAVFVSVYAVRALAEQLAGEAFPDGPEVAAIGAATAEGLADIGCTVHHVPTGSQDSEGLLRALSSTEVEDRHVVIYKGEGGRNVLVEGLNRRGARVCPINCYQRRVNPHPPMDELLRWLDCQGGILLLTSVSILEALILHMPEEKLPTLYRRPVVALSERIASACRGIGFHGQVLVTGTPDRSSILSAMKEAAGN